MRIIRVRALPSRSKPISTPVFRRNVAARRRRPDSALGLSGQVLDFDDPLARHFPEGVQKVRGGARPFRLRRRSWRAPRPQLDRPRRQRRQLHLDCPSRPTRTRRQARARSRKPSPTARSRPCAAASEDGLRAGASGPRRPRPAACRECADVRPRRPPKARPQDAGGPRGSPPRFRKIARSARSGRVTMSSMPLRITGRAASNSTSSWSE